MSGVSEHSNNVLGKGGVLSSVRGVKHCVREKGVANQCQGVNHSNTVSCREKGVQSVSWCQTLVRETK